MRYDVEASTRKDCLAEQDRVTDMSINKISGLRYREELQRGHHILSNHVLDGRAAQYKMDMFEGGARPTQAWTSLAQTAPPPKESEAAMPAEQAEQLKEANHDVPPKSEQKEGSQQAGEGSRRSQHPVISTRSQRPAEAAQPAPAIPRSHASQASKPPSVAPRSNAAASGVQASQRSTKSQAMAPEGKQPSAAASRASNAPKSNQ